jgi:hypothetical protein
MSIIQPVNGARPKATISDHQAGKPGKLIAKFSAPNDTLAMVKGGIAAMRLPAYVGISVAPVEIDRVLDRDVLLIERFDRVAVGKSCHRRAMVSYMERRMSSQPVTSHMRCLQRSFELASPIQWKIWWNCSRGFVSTFWCQCAVCRACDCFAYACAQSHRLPLLFKRADFSKTDIEMA